MQNCPLENCSNLLSFYADNRTCPPAGGAGKLFNRTVELPRLAFGSLRWQVCLDGRGPSFATQKRQTLHRFYITHYPHNAGNRTLNHRIARCALRGKCGIVCLEFDGGVRTCTGSTLPITCIKRKQALRTCFLFMRVTGLEPALRRESDPKSDASANSAIPARVNAECGMQNAEFRIVQNVLAFGTHVRGIIP